MLKYILLGFLNLQSYTGYDLHVHMETSTAHFWNAKLSQIYTTLKKLENDGLLESQVEEQDDRPDKRIYSITSDGRETLQNWLDQPNTQLDQMKSKLLLRLFFGGINDLETVITELKLQKSLHEQQLHQYQTESREVITQASQTASNGEYHKIFWEATRTYGERYEAMVVQWLDETIETLSNLDIKQE